MNTLFWIIGATIVHMIVGAGVLAAIDDKAQRLLKWYKSCPPQIAWLAQPVALMAWPICVWAWWHQRNKD